MDQATALAQNLTFYSGDHFVIRADHTARLGPGGPGRNSVRLQSNKKYTTHVTVCVPPLLHLFSFSLSLFVSFFLSLSLSLSRA